MSTQKEPHYFSKRNNSFYEYRVPPIKKRAYLDLFKKVKNEKAIGEASTSYLLEPTAAKLIFKVVPNAKIIISLRDPIERAYSFFLLRQSGGKTYTFSKAIEKSLKAEKDYYNGMIVNGGFYYNQVKRFFDIFGREQVKIIIFEEFIKNPKNIIKEILDFLEVNADPPESVELVHNILTKPRSKLASKILQNEKIRQLGKKILSEDMAEIVVRKLLGKKITKTKMLKEDRLFLENLYKDDIKNLEKMLGRKLPWFLNNN